MNQKSKVCILMLMMSVLMTFPQDEKSNVLTFTENELVQIAQSSESFVYVPQEVKDSLCALSLRLTNSDLSENIYLLLLALKLGKSTVPRSLMEKCLAVLFSFLSTDIDQH